MLAAALGLAVTFSACEKESVLPDQGAISGSGTNNPASVPGSTPATTPPAATTPPTGNLNLISRLGVKTFKYDAQNRLVDFGYTNNSNQGYTVVYEGDKPVRLNYKGSNNYLLYTYAGDKIVEAKSYYGENLVNYHYKFEYSGDKLVKETKMSYTRSDEGQLGVSEYAYDANGNLSQITVTWSSSNKPEDFGRPTVITYGNYDSKKSPEPFYAYSTVYLPGVRLFENNPGYRDPGTGKELYTYSYNEKGYPKQRISKLEAYPHATPVLDGYEYQ